MSTYIALLRGINVGGKNLLPMKTLATLLKSLGATRVRTYIQSGNAVFESRERSPTRIAARLTAEIEQQMGFAPRALVLTLADLDRAMAGNPYPEAVQDPASLHLCFLAAKPQHPDLAALAGLCAASERFHLSEDVFYLHAPEGIGRSRLAAASERLLGVSLTDRNWRTVCEIRALAASGKD